MLTGCREAVTKMRQFGGACGCLMRSQSEFDDYGAGHAGTALSAALGMATARKGGKRERARHHRATP